MADVVVLTIATAGREWLTCAACGCKLWVYGAVRAPQATTWRGKSVRKGQPVCIEHRTIHQPGARESLQKFLRGKS